ncbi:MAG: hypothetical protein HW388_374 [Dehalococcoidia bacterium]|nr:hypothetical protein [Dehalococcoidia bacterium]
MAIWEYRVIRLGTHPDQEELLNSLGENRWELVAIATQDIEPRAYLKRERMNSPSARESLQEVASATRVAPPPVPLAYAMVRMSARDDPGVRGWVDTGVDVVEDSAGISFTISGEVRESSGELVGPEGHPENLALNPAIGEELPSGSLVAMVGELGSVEPVTNSGFLPTSEKGRLYLAVSDDSYEHNEGEFVVTVTVM